MFASFNNSPHARLPGYARTTHEVLIVLYVLYHAYGV